MSYTPVIPVSGIAGWAFLNRTRETQQAAFDNSATILRNVEYFEETIGKVRTAEELIGDRRLLEVALGAFGLDEDIGNKYYLRKVLEDGTLDDGALANRLSDKRYYEFSKAFGFGDFDIPRTVLSSFPAEIVEAYRTRQFEIAVGDQDPNMRLALGLDSALSAIAGRDTTADGRWYSVMGETPVRTVFEKALGLPASVGALDLDLQLNAFRDRAEARFGDGEVAQFANPEKRDELVRMFLARTQIEAGSAIDTSGGSAALAILQASAPRSILTGLR